METKRNEKKRNLMYSKFAEPLKTTKKQQKKKLFEDFFS